MKTISLTFHQRVRLTLICKAATGTRKDTTLRLLKDLRARLGLSNAELEKYVQALAPDRVMIATGLIAEQPPLEGVAITATEARVLLEKLDAMSLTPDDLDDWADDLAQALTAVAS